tara:strand:- start:530 stop:760 length:231 start_codon:yes stop_codon:yes gene_type:complete
VTAVQIAAFQAGSGVSPGTLLTAIASVILVLVFIWVIWVSLGSFRAWQNGQIVLFDVVWSTLRASIVLMVLGFYLR